MSAAKNDGDPKDPDLEGLLEFLRDHRGFDFTGYKRASLVRRIQRRMQQAGADSYAAYHDRLEADPDEFTALFNTILINVTGFFRDPEVWDVVRDEVVAEILSRKPEDQPLRVWSAGCASGEEPYTLAMVLARALGSEAYRRRVKIYGTDVDEEALEQARHGRYGAKALEGVPEDYREQYFQPAGKDRLAIHPDLRHQVVFGRHDLVSDAPISRVDLLVCRNVLMYLNPETQGRVLARLHFGLADDGYLLVGQAEMLMTRTKLFTPTDLKHRVFRKRSSMEALERVTALVAGLNDAVDEDVRQAHLQGAALEELPTACLLVDAAGDLVAANRKARETFDVHRRDLGRPLRDLEVSYRPAELRGTIEQARKTGEPAELTGVARPREEGGDQLFDIRVTPLTADGDVSGVGILFTDVTETRDLQEELRRSEEERETAKEELQSANEELETTNEELQSTNEELETTNEELQSANEEMETMNEELQSANEELRTMNQEFRLRTEDLERTNTFLDTILSSLDTGVAVLDRDLKIVSWNRQAEQLWGFTEQEVKNEFFLNLEMGLPVQELKKPVKQVLVGEAQSFEKVLHAQTRQGREIDCRITGMPMARRETGERVGVVLIMEQWQGESQETLRDREETRKSRGDGE